MTPFGFTPDNNDDENQKPDDFAAMMRQMQEQIQKQFQELGINPAGFINPFANFFPGGKGKQEALPQSVVRDTAKKFVQAQGLEPLGTNDVTVVKNALEIAELWLNEATVFPAISSGTTPTALSRLDWVDTTLPGWQATMEPLATGLASAISGLL
ncbi:MAG: zinc-dependent metalloprotease, partial [Candidatus Planktophila sp.]